jgi:uncharacterized membrane protein YsdA (DUF1294 family)
MDHVTKSVLLNGAGVLIATGALRAGLQVPVFFAWVGVVNLWLLALMVKDKKAAEARKRRTPEATLLILALAGATPAMFAGRAWLRHKTVKESFNFALYGVVAVQVAFLAWKLFF